MSSSSPKFPVPVNPQVLKRLMLFTMQCLHFLLRLNTVSNIAFSLKKNPKLIVFCLQVDLLKDQVEEVEEQAALVLKELRAKSHDHELLKRDHAESVRAVQLLQQALTDQQAMLQVKPRHSTHELYRLQNRF